MRYNKLEIIQCDILLLNSLYYSMHFYRNSFISAIISIRQTNYLFNYKIIIQFVTMTTLKNARYIRSF